ncbi:MAG: hypothetical protein ACR2MY_03790 [Candidatus Dormibacteria bacterium]
MGEDAVPAGATDLLTPYLRKNSIFLLALTTLIFLPGLITYFGPSAYPAVGDFQWLGIAWGVAVILVLVADEVFVPGKRNLSSGFLHPGHISHSLVTNPMFVVGLLLLVLAPPAVTFYGPVVFSSTPDWPWLLLGWIVAAAAAFAMYTAIRLEERHLSLPGDMSLQ